MPRLLAPPRLTLGNLTALSRHWADFDKVVARLRAGQHGAVDGVWGSAAALVVAALVREAPGMVLVVLPHPGDVEYWFADLATFLSNAALGQVEIFPAWETGRRDAIDESQTQRLRVVKQLRVQSPRVLLTTLPALLQTIPAPQTLARLVRVIRVGDLITPEELLHWLVVHGFSRREAVELPGECSRRGGIIDVFSPDAQSPCRIEFLGDEVASLRLFAPDTQRSLGTLAEVELFGLTSANHEAGDRFGHADDSPGHAAPERATLLSVLPAQSWIVLMEPEELQEQGRRFLERVVDRRGLFTVEEVWQQVFHCPTLLLMRISMLALECSCRLRVASVERLSGDLKKLPAELSRLTERNRVLIACPTPGEQQRLREILGTLAETVTTDPNSASNAPPALMDLAGSSTGDSAATVPSSDRRRSARASATTGGEVRSAAPAVLLEPGQVHTGFRLVEHGVVVLGAQELFSRDHLTVRRLPSPKFESRAIDSFLDLAEGDLVVHVAHGIARYRGLQTLDNKGQVGEHLVLEFAEGARVYVPIDKIDLVQKYVGSGKAPPELSRLGGTVWQKRKHKVAKAVADLAADMLELQAKRESMPGLACASDSAWQQQFEAAFPYAETPDQLAALAEIKADLERSRPMDRLICGDVGFGKTELAIRAAFKVVENGRQVAVLVPTTLLAEQHYRTFSQRLADFPLTVACLSRFRSSRDTRSILERLKSGGIDIVIGTHRLLSKDVEFLNLGLVIIDEEQRFGVEHKEHLKKLRHMVDVLTMTATPIPRTLHSALVGLRDISNLETPPRERLAVETRIHPFDPGLIRQAILHELNREGQVYFVNDRVEDIVALTDELRRLVPEAKFVIGHGQMPEDELEQAMLQFLRGQAQVLVATTIVENGLDIPTANTIFIHRADRFGLSDLHQLRGRVGRYKHRAYCYLLLDPRLRPTPQGIRRLKALEEFSELGAGFRIAMRDLEIRGAGNILGTEQSGHIATVGYELYCQLLENAVRRLKKQPLRAVIDVNIALPIAAYLPRTYIPSERQRLEFYRRLSRASDLQQLADLQAELADRFGNLAEPAVNLLRLQELRLLAARWQIASIHLEEPDLILSYRHQPTIKRLAEALGGRLRLLDDTSASLRLRTAGESTPAGMLAVLKACLTKAPCESALASSSGQE